MTTWVVPTVDTKFHLDFRWWEEGGRNFRLSLRDQLCDECRARFPDHRNTEMVDWIDNKAGVAKVQSNTGDVMVGTVDGTPKYLRTYANGKWTDNLLALPRY